MGQREAFAVTVMLGQHLNPCEDSLTAAIFSHLLHLPVELFWKIFRSACYGKELPEQAGELEAFNAFPKWDPSGTSNKTYVEPDLFFRFREFDLIIEAKRRDEGMQDRSQWLRELIAYTNEYGDEKREVKMVALGGIYGTQTEQVSHCWTSVEAEMEMHHFVCPVIMCRWRGLLHQCKRMGDELNRLEYRASQTLAHIRILGDLIGLFGWHGYSTGKWFSDFDFARHRLSPSTETAHQLLQRRSLQLALV
jgi:hypothetical protein